MITLRLGNSYRFKNNCEQLIDLFNSYRGCCDEIWLCSQSAFPKMETHEEIAAGYVETAKLFRDAGIKVSVQITNTIGHGQSIEKGDSTGLNYEGSPVRRQIGHDGKRADYCYCCNDPYMRDYSVKVVETYSRIMPHTMWIDDDLRPEYHHPVLYPCFCEGCMDKFNKQYGLKLTREELVHKINGSDGNDGNDGNGLTWRSRWVGFLRDSLKDFTRILSEAVIRVSPDSYIAYQYPFVTNYAGADNRFIFDAMYEVSGKPPKSRAGHSFYDDAKPLEMLDKAFHIHYSNRMLPDYVVDRRCEIENIPNVPFGKTIFGTMTESSLYLAYGCNALTYSILGAYEPPSWTERKMQNLVSHRNYWEKLAKAAEISKTGGVAIAVADDMHLFADDGPEFDWVNHRWSEATRPSQYGMPLGFDDSAAKVTLLTKKLAEALSDDVIKKLMQRPVITQTEVVDYLIKRGFSFGESLKLTTNPIVTIMEQYTDHPINGEYAGQTWRATFKTDNAWSISGENVIALSRYVSTIRNNEDYGTASALLVLENNVRWAVIGSGLTDVIISSARRNQIINAADFICGHSLPALIENCDKLVNIPRVDSDGRLVCVTVLHHGIGKTEDDVKIRVRNPKGSVFIYRDGKTDNLLLKAERENDDYIVVMPALDGWDIGTVFCE